MHVLYICQNHETLKENYIYNTNFTQKKETEWCFAVKKQLSSRIKPNYYVTILLKDTGKKPEKLINLYKVKAVTKDEKQKIYTDNTYNYLYILTDLVNEFEINPFDLVATKELQKNFTNLQLIYTDPDTTWARTGVSYLTGSQRSNEKQYKCNVDYLTYIKSPLMEDKGPMRPSLDQFLFNICIDEKKEKRGFVYVFTDEKEEGSKRIPMKIGYTTCEHPDFRIENTMNPRKIKLIFSVPCANPHQMEKQIHNYINNLKKEYSDILCCENPEYGGGSEWFLLNRDMLYEIFEKNIESFKIIN
jgi:hypothetical protein